MRFMEGYIFVYVADIRKLLEICIAFLIARNGEQLASQLLHISILGNDDLRHLQQRNVNGDIGFVSIGLNPSSAVRVYKNILLFEF